MANPFEAQVLNPFQALLYGQQSYDSGVKRSQENAKRSALANLLQGGGASDPNAVANTLLSSGDTSGAATYANLAQTIEQRKAQAERDARDFKFRQDEAQRTQRNADRSYGLQERQLAQGAGGVYGTPIYGTDPATGKIVLGAIGKNGKFQRIDTGGVEPTPGGIKPLDTGTGYVPFDPRRGAVVGPTVQKTGEISKDYAPVVGADGAVSAAPIPGTPAAQEIDTNKTKDEQRRETEIAGATNVKSIIGDIRNKVRTSPIWNPAVGLGSGVASKIPESNAADTAEMIKTITSNIGFDRLQRMRQESPTGGALGAVAVQELESLQKNIASLATNQSKAQFLANLNRIESQYNSIIKRASAYPNAAKHGFGAISAAPDPLGIR